VLLAVDIRNREIALGLKDGDAWKAVRRIGAATEKSADEYAQLMCLVAEEAAGRPGSPFRGPEGIVDSAWISCVVPALAQKLVMAARIAFGVEASLVGPGVRTGLKIRTDNPAEVGGDLVCAAVAALELAGGPCVVVEFSTALAFAAVSGSGEFLGAAIAPGISSAAEALRASAAQIHDVKLEMPRRVIGKNTIQSVQSGILLGYGGLVGRLVELMRAEIAAAEGGARAPESVAVIGTGDETGRPILESCGYARFVPDLVLEGLAIIAGRAAA
jgi:type III pantothenate kinase